MWLWTSRAGFEGDLAEETRGRPAGPALVATERRPAEWPVFARAGFALAAELAPDPDALAAAVAAAVPPRGAWQLAAWTPDTDATNPLAPRADELAAAVLARLPSAAALRHEPDAERLLGYAGTQLQLCLTAADRALVGAVPANDAPCLAPGGRARVRMPKLSPSRAGRKLVEAFEWMRRAPEPGDLCVDLGAAPGGWTAVLLEHRARVVAVDPANLAPELRGKKGLVHVRSNAFEFLPDEPVDWLLCDMAYRPLEVAALLAKWARRDLARALVANIKLPMKQRVPFVARVRDELARGGWRDLRARQLYHDREEFTLSAWR